ncbi:MAG: ATP-dependent Clp protease adaptor ClpS [Bacteroidota bacterium]|nr:ATP-dependent Clp protease adaptor ClpS [Bacteroidota bacterium]
MISTKTHEMHETDVLTDIENHIVVFNDEVNTFDHVIESFMRILRHSAEQAEQCASIIHHNGKCKVKSGAYDYLQPLCTAILDRGISAEIH